MGKLRTADLCGAVAAIVLAAAILYSLELSRERRAQENAGELLIAAERWSTEHPDWKLYPYPLSVQQLILDGYLKELPTNPYTGKPVRFIPPEGRGSPGDISHLRHTEEILPGKVIATDAVFITYGRRKRYNPPWYQYPHAHFSMESPELSRLNWQYVIAAFGNGDGKPDNAYLRHLHAAEMQKKQQDN